MASRTLPFLDDRLFLVVKAGSFPRAYREEQCLWLFLPSNRPDTVRPVVEGWYRRQAWLYLPLRLRQLAQQVGLGPSRITVRSQKTRWGSCSTRGTISLNWRLMMIPSTLVDYVLTHELCHLQHLDHSARFWALLGKLIPDYRERRSALRKASSSLPL